MDRARWSLPPEGQCDDEPLREEKRVWTVEDTDSGVGGAEPLLWYT
jgi:hypothetical protein